MKQLARVTAIVMGTLAFLLLLWQFRTILIIFVISLLLTAAVRPIIAWLVQRGLPSAVARPIVYLSILMLLTGGFWLISKPLGDEFRIVSNRAIFGYRLLHDDWLTNGTEAQRSIVARLPMPDDIFETTAGEEGEQLVQGLVGFLTSVSTAVAGLVLVIVMSIYWSVDQGRFERLWLSFLPPAQRIRARDGWRAIETAVGSYIQSEFVQSLLAALAIGIGFWLLQIPFPLIVALITAVASLIPLIGPLFVLTAALVAGLSSSVALGITAVVYTIMLFAVLEFVVEPRFFARHIYSSLLIILVMIPLVDSLGLVGFIIAPPLAVAIQVLLRQLFWQQSAPQESTNQLSSIEKRYLEVYGIFEEAEGGIYPPEINNILQRLEKLINDSKRIARKKSA